MGLLAVISAVEEIAGQFLYLTVNFLGPPLKIQRSAARLLPVFLASPAGGFLLGHIEVLLNLVAKRRDHNSAVPRGSSDTPVRENIDSNNETETKKPGGVWRRHRAFSKNQ